MKVFLFGKMGAGKSSVCEYMCQHFGFTKAVTVTTRKPRYGEQEGVDYHFVDKEAFLKLLQNDQIMEYDVHNGVYYGSLKSDYEKEEDTIFTLSPKALSSIQGIEHLSVYLKVNPQVQKERILHRKDDWDLAQKRIQEEAKEYENIESLVDTTISVSHKSLHDICAQIVTCCRNKQFLARYPWLKPRICDYSYTLYDDLPIGWKISFGSFLLEDLEKEAGPDFQIDYIKEKFGTLRMGTINANPAIKEIIYKYYGISRNICIECGKPDVGVNTQGWISPICKDCFEKLHPNRVYEECVNLEYTTIANTITLAGLYEQKEYDLSQLASKVRTFWSQNKKS